MLKLPLFAPWKEHRESIPITLLIYTVALLCIGGMGVKSTYRTPFLLVYALLLIVLLSNTIPFTFMNDIIRKNSFINQVFRSPFTKFSIPYALVLTYFFVAAVSFLAQKCAALSKKHYAFPAVVSAAILLIVIQGFPALTGNYFARAMKVSYPQEYFQLFDFFSHVDKNKRIALLPEYTHWGWFNHNWGYDGSGFLWYGIEQPIISRTFDVWSSKSEGYFWEAERALETEDSQAFGNILEKYNIDYIILDKSLTPVVATMKAIQYDRLEDILGKSPLIRLEKRIGFLSVYTVSRKNDKTNNFVSAYTTLPNVGPEITLTNEDTAYDRLGPYKTDPGTPLTAYYPFLDFTTQTTLAHTNWAMVETPTSWQITARLPKGVKNYTVSSRAGTVDINVYKDNTAVKYVMPFTVTVFDTTLVVEFPKIVVNNYLPSKTTVDHCANNTIGSVHPVVDGTNLTVESNNGGVACFSYDDIFLEQRYGYIVKIDNTNTQGRRMYFYILDKTKDQPYLEDRLTYDTAYYVLGARFTQGIGYSFAFQNDSFPTIPSINTLKNVSVYLMPYFFLKNLSLSTLNVLPSPVTPLTIAATKQNYYTYTVSAPQKYAVVVLNQAYHEGWQAYAVDKQNLLQKTFPALFGKKVGRHIVINNWANGWQIGTIAKNQDVVLLYTPQYLEYLGFAIIMVIFCVFAVQRHRKVQLDKLDNTS
jgi:hypothetical protein